MTRKLLLWLPFALGFFLLALFYLGLRKPDDHVIASQIVGQKLPDFATASAVPGQPAVASGDFGDGKPHLLNVFASWCVPCVQEAPILMRLKGMGVEVDGIAVHDTQADLAKFIAQNGNPYARLGLDQAGRAQMAFGSSGVPETFVVDGSGRIVHQHIGVIAEDDMQKLLAMMGRKP